MADAGTSHQLRCCRLVRIVALRAIRRGKRLILVRLLEARILYIVTVDAQRRSAFGQMKIKLGFAALSGLVRDVASVAAHVERGMAAALPGTFSPCLWQSRQRFWPLSPDSAFSS